jgi:hypothetical protein
MTLEFADTKPIKGAGGPGRTAEENPFREIIAAIALRQDSDGDPIAKAFRLTHEAGQRDKAVNRVKRQLSDAGKDNDPAVTVRVSATPVEVKKRGQEPTESQEETTITFWTIARQFRPRTASSDQTDAVTNPVAPDNTPA